MFLLLHIILESTQSPPIILLLDEPTSACDADTELLVERALIASKAAMIIVTHDERQATSFCHHRIILNKCDEDLQL